MKKNLGYGNLQRIGRTPRRRACVSIAYDLDDAVRDIASKLDLSYSRVLEALARRALGIVEPHPFDANDAVAVHLKLQKELR